MPNWCYTNVSFKGIPENIIRLSNDIYKSVYWERDNNYKYCNISYFFSISGFDIKSYNNTYKNDPLQLRCSICNNYPSKIEYWGNYAVIYPTFESA